jgi:hypothetical protein
MQKDRFQLWNESSEKNSLSFVPNSTVGRGEPGLKGRDERKERALDPGLPTLTLFYALFSQQYP